MYIKFLSDKAVMPTRANEYDAGLDITATSVTTTVSYIEYGTDLAVQIPDGFMGLLCARSSISKTSLVLANGVGIIDSGYRGELKFRFKSMHPDFMATTYKVGDKIGQLVIVPMVPVRPIKVDELPESQRGTGGFGSSGS